MKPKYTIVPASELFATEIGVSGAPIPSNGPGKSLPNLKYGLMILGVGMAIYLAYRLERERIKKVVNNTASLTQKPNTND